MGAVFVATDQKFGGKVALKIAMAAGVALDEFRERFAREARIGHRLGRSEGFVRALDWGEIDGTTLYLSMDLVEGARALDLSSGTLAERLERLARAAALVATAHGLGVVHRDLKPQNFLVDGAGKIFLSDFGLAKSRGEADATAPEITRTGLGMGTPTYMPPEQFDDARGTDERADVYALGVMLFQALTGKIPYEGSATSIMQKQVRVQGGLDRPPRPSLVEKSVPPALDDLCARALELDRNKRLADARTFAASLTPPSRGVAVRPVGGDASRAQLAPHPDPSPASPGEGVAPPPSSHVRPVKPPPPPSSNTKVVAIIGCVAIVGMALLSCVLIAIFSPQTNATRVQGHIVPGFHQGVIISGKAPVTGTTAFQLWQAVPLGAPQVLYQGFTHPDGFWEVHLAFLGPGDLEVEFGNGYRESVLR